MQLEYTIPFPGSYILSYDALPDWCNRFMIHRSYKKINKIATDIRNNHKMIKLKLGILYNPKNEESLQKSIASYNDICQGYTVNDTCIKCGKCALVCPTQNITLKDGHVTFGTNCQQCMACIQWCPQKAIDYKGKAASRKRYHHMDISLKDIILHNKIDS